MFVDTFNQKELLLEYLTKLAGMGNLVFRGYNTQEQLLPSVVRKNMVNVESELLFQFERYGAQYINANNPVDFMSYAQHFGLPTRLLDFTYNPFVALYFALFSPKSNGRYVYAEDKIYYYIRVASIDENILIQHVPYFNEGPFFEINSMAQRSVALMDTVEMMFDKTKKIKPDFLFNDRSQIIQSFFRTIATHIGADNTASFIGANEHKVAKRTLLFIDPSQANQRLIMQQGLFMFPYILDQKEHLNIIEENTRVIRINKDLREPLLKYLDTIGINAFRIMPDLASVCGAVERKVKDMRASNDELLKKKTS